VSNKVNILLVDDRPEGIITLKAVLSNPQYKLICANSGAAALKHILNHDFAVILMDVQMSDMDGFETAKIIKQRERSKDIPIIFVTAIDKADKHVSIGYEVGAVDYIFKPFDPEILKSKVSVFVDLYRKTHKIIEQGAQLRDLERRETARILSELEIESRRRYQSLADAVPQILWRANKDGIAEYFNHFWHIYSGQARSQNLAQAWDGVAHADDLAILNSKWVKALEAKLGFDAEIRLERAQDASYRWHFMRVVPELDSFSEIINWIGTATDIHDQKLALDELVRAKKIADTANETKSRFLANMSHEIRTPLGAILGFTEVLVRDNLDPVKKAEYIATLRRNGEQLSKIIDEILDLSKVEAGKFELETKKISLIELLNDVKSLLSLTAQEKALSLEFKVVGKIPKEVFTDPTRLRQILINIIGNGIKFTKAGKIVVEVSFSAANSLVKIDVIDNGPGLTQAQISGLFKPFSQVDSSMSRQFGGTGLGLTLSRNFANAMGGNVVVEESAPNDGCRFTITFQSGNIEAIEMLESLDAKKDPQAAKKNTRSVMDLTGVKVLFVDDSEDNQELVAHFLTSAGAGVDLASNGREGVDQALAGDHHVILMDVQMPILDGYLATSELRRRGFKAPIIALTAHAMKEERQRCIQVGCDDYLTKPLNHITLIECVYEHAHNSLEKDSPL
jgi:signal transduction histidine kinase